MDWLLRDAQWAKMEPILPKAARPFRRAKRKGGRPRLPDRRCFEAMLWVMFGGSWRRLPKHHGSARAVLARIREWHRHRLLVPLWRAYLESLPNPDRWLIERFFQTGHGRPKWEPLLIEIYRNFYSRHAFLWWRWAKAQLTAQGLRAKPFVRGSVNQR